MQTERPGVNMVLGRFRVVNKVRFTAFLTALILIFILSTSAFLGYSNVSAAEPEKYIAYHVQPGDTLWDIAKEYGPSDMDIKQFIYQIKCINDTDAAHLQAGQVINIPVLD